MSTTFHNTAKHMSRQRGFSLVTAIFLLVVMAVLGAGMLAFSTAQNQGMAMDAMGSRAYQAANAGIEWAAYNIASSPGVAVAPAVRFAPGTNPLGGNLAPFSVTVGYTMTPFTDALVAGSGVQAVVAYEITSTATYGAAGSSDRVMRVLNAKIVQ